MYVRFWPIAVFGDLRTSFPVGQETFKQLRVCTGWNGSVAESNPIMVPLFAGLLPKRPIFPVGSTSRIFLSQILVDVFGKGAWLKGGVIGVTALVPAIEGGAVVGVELGLLCEPLGQIGIGYGLASVGDQVGNSLLYGLIPGFPVVTSGRNHCPVEYFPQYSGDGLSFVIGFIATA
jgi:hypothetical protein